MTSLLPLRSPHVLDGESHKNAGTHHFRIVVVMNEPLSRLAVLRFRGEPFGVWLPIRFDDR